MAALRAVFEAMSLLAAKYHLAPFTHALSKVRGALYLKLHASDMSQGLVSVVSQQSRANASQAQGMPLNIRVETLSEDF